MGSAGAGGGSFGVVRLLMVVEDQGASAQHVRIRAWPRCSRGAAAVGLVFALLAAMAALDGAWAASAALASIVGFLVVRIVMDCGAASAVTLEALESARSRYTQ